MAFVKRARLPQAEDSAPMRVSRTKPPQASFRAAALTSLSPILTYRKLHKIARVNKTLMCGGLRRK